jgi:hypothetical protein
MLIDGQQGRFQFRRSVGQKWIQWKLRGVWAHNADMCRSLGDEMGHQYWTALVTASRVPPAPIAIADRRRDR